MMLLQLSMTIAEGSTINLDIDILVGVPKLLLCCPMSILSLLSILFILSPLPSQSPKLADHARPECVLRLCTVLTADRLRVGWI